MRWSNLTDLRNSDNKIIEDVKIRRVKGKSESSNHQTIQPAPTPCAIPYSCSGHCNTSQGSFLSECSRQSSLLESLSLQLACFPPSLAPLSQQLPLPSPLEERWLWQRHRVAASKKMKLYVELTNAQCTPSVGQWGVEV